VGVEYAAKRIAVAYLDATAIATRGGRGAEVCTPGEALVEAVAPSDACP
jgi:hypothetical protein